LGVRYEWEALDPLVGLRFTKEGLARLKAEAKLGRRVPPEERWEARTYSFAEVREVAGQEPGIYLIEAFHTQGRPAARPGDMPNEVWSEVVDASTEELEDLDREEWRGEDPLWFYIGMANNLHRRFNEHEQKASGLRRGLRDAGKAVDLVMTVSLQRAPTLVVGGTAVAADFSSDLVRVLFEHAAIAEYRQRHPEREFLNVENVENVEGA